jgi:HSP20 family protein
MAFRGTALSAFGGPGASATSLRRELDRIFEDAFGSREGGVWAPAVDIRETDREIALTVELPGIKPDNVDVSVDNGVLSIRGEKREERTEGEEGRYHLLERRRGAFFRSFVLPQGVDEEQIDANFEHGLLTVRIPKAALPQPRRIQIGGQEVRGGQEAGGEASTRTGAGRGKGQTSGRVESTGDRMAAQEAEGQSRRE